MRVLVAGVALALCGCSDSGDERAKRAALEFNDALGDLDGARACSMLGPKGRAAVQAVARLEYGAGVRCEHALSAAVALQYHVDDPRVTGVEGSGSRRTVRVHGSDGLDDTFVVAEIDGEWRVDGLSR